MRSVLYYSYSQATIVKLLLFQRVNDARRYCCNRDPGRCDPPLDYWFASDEPGLREQCQGKRHPPPSPPPSPAPGPVGQPVRFHAVDNSSACLVAPGSGGYSAWLQVGPCEGKTSQWQRVNPQQLESVAYPGSCLNVFGGPPACCPGGADSNSSKFHLTECGGGPGNNFRFDEETERIALECVAKWSACTGLCAASSSPRVTLRDCSEASTQWKRVPVATQFK